MPDSCPESDGLSCGGDDDDDDAGDGSDSFLAESEIRLSMCLLSNVYMMYKYIC